MLTREWVLVKEEGEVLRQRQATINATRITAVAGKDKNKPSWRLLAVENTLITMLMLCCGYFLVLRPGLSQSCSLLSVSPLSRLWR